MPQPAAPTTAPELILFNGVIYTGEGLAEDKPVTVQAIAIGDGKVLAVGTTAAITRLAARKTRLLNLRSAAFVFPGFNDAHTHMGSAGRTKLNVDLTGVKSLADMLAKVQTFANAAPAGHWLTGGNWDHTLWEQKTLPTRQDLDQVTGAHPTFLGRIDGHIAIANSAALKAAGITGKTIPPQGGAIDLDPTGQPTGILRESAQGLVDKVIPPPSHDERRRGDELAIADALSHGITSVQDFSDWDDFLVYEEMEKEGKLNLRITEWLPFKAPLNELIKMRAHHDANDPMLHTGFLKGLNTRSRSSTKWPSSAPAPASSWASTPSETRQPPWPSTRLKRPNSRNKPRPSLNTFLAALPASPTKSGTKNFPAPGTTLRRTRLLLRAS